MLTSFGALAVDGDEMTQRDALAPFSDIAVPAWMRAPLLSVWPAEGRYIPSDCTTVPYRPVGFLAHDIEDRRRAAYTAMSAAACDAGIPVGLFDALVLTESAYNPRAISPKQAYGLTQLMPGTAGDLGVDRYDPVQNLHGGARYLRAQLDSFGKVHLALAAYNAGPGRVKGGQIPPITETKNYVRNVLGKWARLAGHHQVLPNGEFAGSPAFSAIPTRPARAASVQIF
ncbi:lytic transglycosylase domain-containing protein (plasmid) [Sphingomonas sp. IC081]|nr:lytic transglycosylase domain-containing protein [Sphingomonas sp. IC081]